MLTHTHKESVSRIPLPCVGLWTACKENKGWDSHHYLEGVSPQESQCKHRIIRLCENCPDSTQRKS